MKTKKLSSLLPVCIVVCVLSSCAAAGNVIDSSAWIGYIDLAVAAGITLFILRGKNK